MYCLLNSAARMCRDGDAEVFALSHFDEVDPLGIHTPLQPTWVRTLPLHEEAQRRLHALLHAGEVFCCCWPSSTRPFPACSWWRSLAGARPPSAQSPADASRLAGPAVPPSKKLRSAQGPPGGALIGLGFTGVLGQRGLEESRNNWEMLTRRRDNWEMLTRRRAKAVPDCSKVVFDRSWPKFGNATDFREKSNESGANVAENSDVVLAAESEEELAEIGQTRTDQSCPVIVQILAPCLPIRPTC